MLSLIQPRLFVHLSRYRRLTALQQAYSSKHASSRVIHVERLRGQANALPHAETIAEIAEVAPVQTQGMLFSICSFFTEDQGAWNQKMQIVLIDIPRHSSSTRASKVSRMVSIVVLQRSSSMYASRVSRMVSSDGVGICTEI